MSTPPARLPRPEIISVAPQAQPQQVIEACIHRAAVLVQSEADPHGLLHRTLFKCLLDVDADVLRKVCALIFVKYVSLVELMLAWSCVLLKLSRTSRNCHAAVCRSPTTAVFASGGRVLDEITASCRCSTNWYTRSRGG